MLYNISMEGKIFQSTPSAGRATRISIHALRGEGDKSRRDLRRLMLISIHALRGEGDR